MKTTLSKCLLGLVVALILGLSATVVLISNNKTQVNAISDHVALLGSYDMYYNPHYVAKSTYNNGSYTQENPYYPMNCGYLNQSGIFPVIDDYNNGYDVTSSYMIYAYMLYDSYLNYDYEYITDINTIILTYTYIFNEDYIDDTISTRYTNSNNQTCYFELGFYFIPSYAIYDEDDYKTELLSCYNRFSLRVTEYNATQHLDNITLTFTHKELGYTINQFLNAFGHEDGEIGIYLTMTYDLYSAYEYYYYNENQNIVTPTIQLYSLPIEDVIVQNGYTERELQEYGDSKYAEGYIVGEDNGLIRGYEDGYEQGYDDGYHDGYNGETPLYNHSFASVLSTAWSSASSLLQTEVFGNLTILHLILIPLVLGVLLIILKLIRG